MEYNIYRLKDGSRPVSWQLPLKGEMIEKFLDDKGVKKSLGLRLIHYVPGTETFYKEDHQGDLKPQRLWFEHGDLFMPKADKLTNKLLKKHRLYGVKYELWTKDTEIKEKLEVLRFKGEARQLIEGSDTDKIKAIALTIFGVRAFHWNEEECELNLREYADTKPKKLSDLMNEKDYESKFISSQAFVKGIVKENAGKNAVIWTDSEGIIVNLAKGEKGIKELGRFLSNRSEDSLKVLQSIGDRLAKMEVIIKKEESQDVNLLAEKDAELKALKKKMKEEAKAKDAELKALKVKLAEQAKAETTKDTSTEDVAIEQARKDYKEMFDKEVPVNKKNDLAWINAKLNE